MSEYKRLTKQVFDKVQGCEDKMTMHGQSLYDLYNRLAELEDKIENGTLIELPCKVGDKVYQFDNGGEIYESDITCLIYDCGNFDFEEMAIGKSVFLTKSEAEARLKELREKNNG